MLCKYCKKKDHNIDDCLDIICRMCKQYGHPYWKCKKKIDNKSKTSVPVKEEVDDNKNIKYYMQFVGKLWGEL